MTYMNKILPAVAAAAMLSVSFAASAQKYADGLIDKSVAVVGNEMISISQIEEQVQMMRVDGVVADRNMR